VYLVGNGLSLGVKESSTFYTALQLYVPAGSVAFGISPAYFVGEYWNSDVTTQQKRLDDYDNDE